MRNIWIGAAMALAGCGGTSNPPPTAASSGTGAFGVVTVNGKQLMYYPTQSTGSNGHGTISVIDVGQSGNGMLGANALVTTIDLGSTDMATTTAGNANIVVAAGTGTLNVWFINPATNTLIKTIQLDAGLLQSSFSGGGGYVTGIALDTANNRAILSVYNGFLYVDLNAMVIVDGGVTSAPAENFGFDGVHELVADPFYGCSGSFCDYQLPDGGGEISAGINIINLKTNTVYTYENFSAAVTDPTQPLNGSEPDSAAFDPGLQWVAVPIEQSNPGQQDFLDLSKASYGSSTFSAPLVIVPTTNEYDGVAIETKTHLAFLETEGESTVALVDMSQLTDDGLPPQALVEATMPNTPLNDAGFGDNIWSNETGQHHDPHGITVTTGLLSNGPVGFVVSDDGSPQDGIWVARIDLAMMLAAGPDAGMAMGADGGDWVLPATALAPAITMLNGAVQE